MVGLLSITPQKRRIGQEVGNSIREQRAYLEGLVRGAFAERGATDSRASAIADAIAGGLAGIVLLKMLDPELEAEAAIDALSCPALEAPGSEPARRSAAQKKPCEG